MGMDRSHKEISTEGQRTVEGVTVSMQVQKTVHEPRATSVRNAMIGVFLCAIINIVLACVEFFVFLPEGHWSIPLVDTIIDFGLSIVLILMAQVIHRKNGWGWMGAIGILAFLILNQVAIAPAIWSYSANFVWFTVITAWIIVQGMFLCYIPFSKKIREEISLAFLLQPSHKK
jgi:hypothetical protein